MKSILFKHQSPHHRKDKRSNFCEEVKFLISFPGWKQRGNGAYS